jgi:glutaredoxin
MSIVRLAQQLLLISVIGVSACRKGEATSEADTSAAKTQAEGEGQGANSAGQVVTPPFPVRGELEGLLMVWFDAEGLHTAQKRSEIPEAQRAQVRIDALDIAPDARPDPESVYVADLSKPNSDGSYPVRQTARSWFDAQVDRAKPRPAEPAAAAEGDAIVIYKAAWCGVCRSAAAYLKSRNVAFIEKDVEKEPGASDEMLRKARAKGLTPRGVPVIDFHGEILMGFDQQHMAKLLDRYAKPI